MGETFDRTPLPKALFHANDLTEARFDRAWLAKVTFSHCNLENVRIRRSHIHKMTVDGVRIDLLLEAELDRLDPRRVQVCIADIHDVAEVRRAVAELERVREEVIARTRSVPCQDLVAHGEDWHWSALEHLRHLVFAEELYTNRWILQNGEPFSRLGLLPDWLVGQPGYEAVGTEPVEDLEPVVAAWQRVHARTQQVLERLTEDLLQTSTKGRDFGQGDVGAIFRTLTGHDMHHIRAAEGVLTEVSRG